MLNRRQIEQAIVVARGLGYGAAPFQPTQVQAETLEPVSKLERLNASTLATWTKIVEWEVLEPGGYLRVIGITPDPNAAYKLTIGDKTMFDNKSLSNVLNEDFKRFKLKAGRRVAVEARSVNGNAIGPIDATITGEQIVL